jgi:serine phosphatase RsbU (regulator of sigma subunit)
MSFKHHQHELQRFIRSLPIGSRAALLLTVFCLFATFGFVSDVVSVGRHSAARIAFDVGLSGLMAILYSFVGTRSGLALASLGVAQIALTVLMAHWSPPILFADVEHSSMGLSRRLGFDALGITMGVIIGYSALTTLLTREGSRYLRLRTEITLAQNIHRGLVPTVAGRHPGIVFFGASYPSGEVGGDLVDVVVGNGDRRWIGYVADVSGHGVQAGVVMAMVKSAVRMAIARGASIDTLLAETNDVLTPLISANMFVTAAFIEVEAARVQIGLAGHLPVLHFRPATHTVEEVSVHNFALGFFAGQPYATSPLTCAAGDVFVVITDGLIETFDKHDREFGLGALKAVVARTGHQPLDQMLAAIVAAARQHGPQQDDQTALLVRFVEEHPGRDRELSQ